MCRLDVILCENVFVFVCVSVAPEPVQADSWAVVSGGDQGCDSTKVRTGSQRSSVCTDGVGRGEEGRGCLGIRRCCPSHDHQGPLLEKKKGK